MRFFQQADIDSFASKYEPVKCDDIFTVRGHEDDNREFIPLETEIYTLLIEIFCRNPHLKLQWETALDYRHIARDAMPRWGRWTFKSAEAVLLRAIEAYNSTRWTFQRGVSFCPYWKLTREEYDSFSKEMLENEIKRLGLE